MKMKRTLSLVLALVMVLGTFGTVFAETVVETPETNVDAGALLKDLGVLVGNAEGDLMLEEGLKRQDAVILLAKLMGEFDVAADFPTVEGEVPTYEDIEDHFYLPFLAWAQANETFVGHTPAKFGFNEEMTVQQYAKVLLTVLGHEVGPDADVKWEDVMDTAKDLGLVDTTEEVGFTRGVMAMMTYNALNTKMKDSDQTLAEFLDIEMPEVEEEEAKELKIEKVYSENLAEVVVELSNAKLVENMEALTNASNYRVDGKTVKNVEVIGNELVLSLVPYGKVVDQGDFDTLVKGKTHTLTIRNIKGISQSEKFVGKDVAVPTVENVEFLGEYGIKVTTSEPVKNPQERNFRLDDKTTRVLIEQYGRDLILTPYYSNDKFDLDAKELVINELEDFANYRAATVFEDIKELENDAAPMVEKAYRNGDKLTLVFDRDIYEPSVVGYANRRAEGNVSFVERRAEFFADKGAVKTDTNVAEYTFTRVIPRDAVVTVEGVQNHNKKAMDKQEIETVLFEDDYAPVVISKLSTVVYATDATTKGNKITDNTSKLKIEFDKNIKELEDVLKLNKAELNNALKVEDFFEVYKLEVSYLGRMGAKDIVEIEAVEADSITISFKGLNVNEDRKYDYILEVKDFTDNARNRMEREYIDFQVLPKVATFNVTGVEASNRLNNVEIVVKFNDVLDRASAERASNYEIDGDLLVDEVRVDRSLREVTLVIKNTTVAKLRADGYSILEVTKRVENADEENVLNRYWNIFTGKVDDTKAPVVPTKSITYIVNDTNVDKKETNVDRYSLVKVDVNVKKHEGKSLEITLYEDNKLVASHVYTTLSSDDATTNLEFLTLDTGRSTEYEINSRVLDGRTVILEESLTVNVQDFDATGEVKYVGTNIELNVEGNHTVNLVKTPVEGKLEFKAGSDLSKLTEKDFKVSVNSTKDDKDLAKSKVELSGNGTKLTVTITAENGSSEVYVVDLEVAAE